MTFRIIYEDNHLLVVEKPAGLLSQGDFSGEATLLDEAREYVKISRNKPGNVYLGLVHRLDRPVSGVMVLARTSKAAGRLQKQFAGRDVRKFYLARVDGFADIKGEGWTILEDRLIREGDRTLVARENEGGQEARLRYLEIKERKGLILVELMTGRKHQIRAQLAARGMPLLGDSRYGGEALDGEGISLHSLALRILHPTRLETITFYASPPDYICGDREVLQEIQSIVIREVKTGEEEMFYT